MHMPHKTPRRKKYAMFYNSDLFREACGDPVFLSSSVETDAHVLLWLLLEEGSEVEGVKALG